MTRSSKNSKSDPAVTSTFANCSHWCWWDRQDVSYPDRPTQRLHQTLVRQQPTVHRSSVATSSLPRTLVSSAGSPSHGPSLARPRMPMVPVGHCQLQNFVHFESGSRRGTRTSSDAQDQESEGCISSGQAISPRIVLGPLLPVPCNHPFLSHAPSVQLIP